MLNISPFMHAKKRGLLVGGFVLLALAATAYQAPTLLVSDTHDSANMAVVCTGQHTFIFHPRCISNPAEPYSKVYLRWTARRHDTGAGLSGYIKNSPTCTPGPDPRWVDTTQCVDFDIPVSSECYGDYTTSCGSTSMTDWDDMMIRSFQVLYKPAMAGNEFQTTSDRAYRTKDYIYVIFHRHRVDLWDEYDEERIYIYRAEYLPNNFSSPLGVWERIPEDDACSNNPDLLDQNGKDVDASSSYLHLIRPYYDRHNQGGWNLYNTKIVKHDLGRVKVFLTYISICDGEHNYYTECYEVDAGLQTCLRNFNGQQNVYSLPDNVLFLDAAYSEKFHKDGGGNYHKYCTTAILYADGTSNPIPLRLKVVTNHYTGVYNSGTGKFQWTLADTWVNPGQTSGYSLGVSLYSADKRSVSLSACDYDTDSIQTSAIMNKFFLQRKWNGKTAAQVITLTRNTSGVVTGASATTPVEIPNSVPGNNVYVQQGAAFVSGNRLVYLHQSDSARNILGNDKNPWDSEPYVGIEFEKNPYTPGISRLASVPNVVRSLPTTANAAWFNSRLPERVVLAWSNVYGEASTVYGKVSEPNLFKDIKFSTSADIVPKGTQPPNAYMIGNTGYGCNVFDYRSFSGVMNPYLDDVMCVDNPDVVKMAFIQYDKPSVAAEDQVYSTKLQYDYVGGMPLVSPLTPMRLAWRTAFTLSNPMSGAIDLVQCSGNPYGSPPQTPTGLNTVEVGRGNTGLNFFNDVPIQNNGWYFWRIDTTDPLSANERGDSFTIVQQLPQFRFNFIDWRADWTLPQVSPNDDVCSPESIQCGVPKTGGLTQYATDGGSPLCGIYGPDVWYNLTVAQVGTRINATFSHGTTSGAVAIHTGANCNSLTQQVCGASIYYSTPATATYVTTEANQQLWIQIKASYYQSQTLTLECGLAGSSCSLAMPTDCGDIFVSDPGVFEYGEAVPGSTTQSGPCASSPYFTGHWFEIDIPANKILTVKVSDWDVRFKTAITFYEACGQPAIACKASPGLYNQPPTELVHVNSGGSAKKLYVLVNHFYDTLAWAIEFTCTTITVPGNDEKTGATTISCGYQATGYLTVGATPSTVPSANPCSYANMPDVWYKYEAPSGYPDPILNDTVGPRLTISFTDDPYYGKSLGSGNHLGFIALYEVNDQSQLRLADSRCGRYNGVFSMSVECGSMRTYYIRIGSNSPSPNKTFSMNCFSKLQ